MSLRIGVVTIGDELLNGEMADTNTAAIADALGRYGYALRESISVGDVENDIIEILQEMARKRDVVIVTGGLGPTNDDLTARAAARAFSRRLVLNEEALAGIRGYFQRRGRPMHPSNEKQALLPQKVQLLPNPVGTAPGFLLHHNGRDIFFLPGVPEEMAIMLKESVLPHVLQRSGTDFPLRQRIFKLFGVAEPEVESVMHDTALPEGVRIAFGVEFPLVHLKLRAEGEEAETLLDKAEVAVRRALDEWLVAVDDETLAGNVARMLTAAGKTLALAESCTGGLIAEMLTDIPGASAFFDCSAVTYANRAKQGWLGVSGEILEAEGAVSEACALAMARGVRRAADVDLALAVTGIAGPEGGTAEKPVGTIFIALSTEEGETVQHCRFSGTRRRIRLLTAVTALDRLRRHLGKRMST